MKCRFFSVKCRLVADYWEIFGCRWVDAEVRPYTSTIRPPCQRGLSAKLTEGFRFQGSFPVIMGTVLVIST